MGVTVKSFTISLGLLASITFPVLGADPVRFSVPGVRDVLFNSEREAEARALIVTLESQLEISRRQEMPRKILTQLQRRHSLIPWRGEIRRWAIRADPTHLLPEVKNLVAHETDVASARAALEAIVLLDTLSTETQDALSAYASDPLPILDSRSEKIQIEIADALARRSERLQDRSIRVATISLLMDTFWRAQESVSAGILETIVRLDPDLKETLELWLTICKTPEMVTRGPLVSLFDKLGTIQTTDARVFGCVADWSDDSQPEAIILAARRAAWRLSLSNSEFRNYRAGAAHSLLNLAEATHRSNLTRIDAVNAFVGGLNDYQLSTTLLRANYTGRVAAAHETLSEFCGAGIALVTLIVPTP